MQFGTGGFLRGFVDAFVDQTNRRGSRGPGRVVVVGSTGSGRVADLNDQDGLYTLLMRGKAGGSVVDEIGRTAVQLLLEQIDDDDSDWTPQNVVLTTKLYPSAAEYARLKEAAVS